MNDILIIEDDEELVELLAVRLRAAGYGVRFAADAMQGTKMAIQDPPGLVLLDLKMPAGGGAAVLKSLRNSIHTKQVPVIVITGAADGDAKKKILEYGIKTYIQKPFKPEDLLEAVSLFLPKPKS